MSLLCVGCASQAQFIELSEQPNFAIQTIIDEQPALVKVVDNRNTKQQFLGYRSQRNNEKNSLNAKQPLTNTLTARLQETLMELGFGGEDLANAIHIKLSIKRFHYQCEQRLMTSCQINMQGLIEVMDDYSSFRKTYTYNEKRLVATPPVKDYNQLWLNQALDSFWQKIFTDPQLLGRLKRGSKEAI